MSRIVIVVLIYRHQKRIKNCVDQMMELIVTCNKHKTRHDFLFRVEINCVSSLLRLYGCNAAPAVWSGTREIIGVCWQ
jgi:hypothetical protein